MGEDSIRVLHFHNPYLIWVEVRQHDKFSLRQVGLFGVVPRQASMVDGERLCTKSDRWDPRVNEIVEEFFETKHQLTFKSIYRLDDDDQSSIFPDQPHIFGEISLKKQDGSKKLLTTCLDNSVYAYKSKNEFWQMLTTGKIETVLKEDEQIDVISKIIQYYKDTGKWNQKKDIFYRHLSPAQLSIVKETTTSKLTVENLERHLILTSQNISNEDYIVQNPQLKTYQDFNNSPKPELASVEFVENVLKKLTVIKGSEKKNVTSPVMNENDITKIKNDDGVFKKGKDMIKLKNKEFNKKIYDEICDLTLQDVGKSDTKSNIKIYDEELNDEFFRSRACSRIKKIEERSADIKVDPVPFSIQSSPVSTEKPDEILVAYGPPMMSLQKLVRKKVPRKMIEQTMIEDVSKAATINWEDEVSSNSLGDHKGFKNVHSSDRDDRKRTDSDDFRSDVDDCKGTGNLDNDRKDIANSSIKTDVVNVNDRMTIREKFIDLNNPKIYNDFIQSKQDRREFKDVLKSCGVTNSSYKEKQDSKVYENKDKISKDKKNSRNKLLDRMRKRKEKDMLNSSSSSNGNTENKATHFVKHEKRVIANDNQTDDTDQKPNDTSSTTTIASKDTDLEELKQIHAKLGSEYNPLIVEMKTHITATEKAKADANPFKNLEGGKSVFVDNLVQPLILAHSKNENKILPHSSLRDIPFKMEIHNTLRNKQVKSPNRLQSVSWPYILRGHSMVMISATNSGKTLGYIPAVCNLVMDYNFQFTGLGPICVIVCATVLSVLDVTKQCRMFLNRQRVVASYPGLDHKKLITDLVNGCDILVSTPSMLYRLLGLEIGVDLRRLTTLVFEACERLSSVYELELKAIQLHVKQMLRCRTDKQVKVQYILASRLWCDFMTPLAKKAPDTIVTFAAFHECVLYSKTHTSVSFVKNEKKVDTVVEFLKEINNTDSLTVIVCRTDDEVDLLQRTLTKLKYTFVACNNEMDINELYKIRTEVLTSILICCDSNLSYLNVTYANYLVHYSMPSVYSRFCRRFAVLNDNYPSIFRPSNANVKIKILLDDSNVEQLPKILKFIKRCSSAVPDVLDKVATQVLEQKDLAEAKRLVPICDSLLSIGECADSLTCQERHAILGAFDEPEPWMPLNGIITFKIIHYNSAISYSARLLTHSSGGNQKKYPETYGALCLKLGMFFSKEQNQRLHGEPSVGDICALSVRKNFISRCQILKIIDYEKKKAKHVVINLIDEEFISVVRAVELYYLPDKFKDTETHVVKVRLAGVRPQDKDVTFSDLATNSLKRLTDEDEQLYLRGRVVMTVGKTIFVETLEACADLTAFGETIVKYDLKKLLLDTHAIPNPDHLSKLTKLCEHGNFKLKMEPKIVKVKNPIKKVTEHRWAHLDENDWLEVIIANLIDAGKLFVRLFKFDKCVKLLKSDIKKYVENNPTPIDIDDICVKDIVLAEFPDDSMYERAIVEEIIDSSKVKCFFVDKAAWRDVAMYKIKTAPEKIIKQMPFQSIECRLLGIQPPGEDWTEFSTNWLHDNCLVNINGIDTRMYVKYIVKEKAEVTGGHKYGIILIDISTECDTIINNKMVELNLASGRDDEIEFLKKPLDFVREKPDEDFTELLDITKAKKATAIKQSSNSDSEESITIPVKFTPTSDFKESISFPVKFTPTSDFDESVSFPVKITPTSDSEESITIPDKFTQTSDFEKSISFPVKITPTSNSERSIPFPVIITSNSNSEEPVPITTKLTPCSDSDCDWEHINKEIVTTSNITPNKPKDIEEKYPPLPQNIPSPDFEDLDKWSAVEFLADETEDLLHDLTKSFIKIFKDENNKTEVEEVKQDITSAPNIPKFLAITNSPKKDETNTELIIKTDHFDEAGKVMVKRSAETNNIKVNGMKNDVMDVSFDSDDTSSCCTGATKPNTKKNKLSVLDSDDTQSITTETDKDITTEVKKEIKNDNLVPRLKTPLIVELDTILNTNEALKHEIVSTNTAPKTINNTQINKTETATDKPIKGKAITVTESSETIKRPQLVWRQNNNKITIKIKLIADEYELESHNRTLKFSAYQNEVKYAFDIELYGLIQPDKTTHANKGQYILVNLFVLIKKVTWLKLATGLAKNWIVYDVDYLNTSSGEEEEPLYIEDQRRSLVEKAFVEEELKPDEEEEEDKNPDDVDDNPYDKYN